MKEIQVRITEKDKGLKSLTLLNLRDELVNFLYKDTIANSTKTDLLFFVLLFFVSIKPENKTLFETIFDEALPKLRKLNEEFVAKDRRLKAGEYQKLVEKHGLTNIFKFDVFFILVEAIQNLEVIEKKFEEFLEKNRAIKSEIGRIRNKYEDAVSSQLKAFQSSEIEDDRIDVNGRYQDLSKSVYRTVRMRNSRNLDLNLQKYTSIQELTSKSPIDFTFIQHVDLQIIFDLWSKYHLAEYTQTVASNVAQAVKNHVDFQVHLGDLVPMWLFWEFTSSRDRKEKERAKVSFDNAKQQPQNHQALEDLTATLVKSVLNADEQLKKEIKEIRDEVNKHKVRELVMQDKEQIKKLEERLAQLENLSVIAKVL
jgi:hypothetical protein